MKEVKILGAGPAGLTAAINLAKEGYQVTIFEKEKECGMRFNGDFQGIENWSSQVDVLDDLNLMNIKTNFYFDPIRNCEIYDPDLKKREIRFNKPALYMVRRGDMTESLDLGLKEQALARGVKIVFNKKATQEEADIIAGGPMGPVKIDGIARGIVFDTEMEDTLLLILDDNIAPKGYAYLVIKHGKGCLTTVLFKNFKDAKIYFDRAFERFCKIKSLSITNRKDFGGIGNFFLRKNYEDNGKLIVGEAAGLQDFLFGFGMRYAITSGYLAAKSIVENTSYDTLIKQQLGTQLRISISNRFLFNLLGNRGYKALLKRGQEIDQPLERIRQQYAPSLMKELILPIGRIAFNK